MAPAGRTAVLIAGCVLCLVTTSTGSRDASPLKSLQTEEGNIDDLIYRIEQLQEQKRAQQKQPPPAPRPSSVRHPSKAQDPSTVHPPRRFAYYPSDPEYHAPRRPEVVTRPAKHADPGQGQAASKGAKVVDAAAAVTDAPAPLAVTSGDLPVTARYRGDPEEVSHDPARHKRPSDDTQVVQVQADALLAPAPSRDNMSDIYFIVTVAGVCAMAVGVTVAGGFCYHRMQKRSKAASDAEYPAYGVTGPSRDLSPSGDRKLAQSAQMYHYQHQKQQMMAMEKTHNGRHGSASDVDSEEENEEGDYTVYECPGLAPTGEMEVKNPLFQDDQTPAPPAASDSK
ncbi:protein cab-1-like [Amphibalanus amphitrite]|uniref:protein cab-1-like n=1 Tax=Amphibalanus amphitrite TaxID=1232801 RepID=UPI001C917D7C|nr:protein cab-1-like [Amphibalanus amphitrite]